MRQVGKMTASVLFFFDHDIFFLKTHFRLDQHSKVSSRYFNNRQDPWQQDLGAGVGGSKLYHLNEREGVFFTLGELIF